MKLFKCNLAMSPSIALFCLVPERLINMLCRPLSLGITLHMRLPGSGLIIVLVAWFSSYVFWFRMEMLSRIRVENRAARIQGRKQLEPGTCRAKHELPLSNVQDKPILIDIACSRQKCNRQLNSLLRNGRLVKVERITLRVIAGLAIAGMLAVMSGDAVIPGVSSVTTFVLFIAVEILTDTASEHMICQACRTAESTVNSSPYLRQFYLPSLTDGALDRIRDILHEYRVVRNSYVSANTIRLSLARSYKPTIHIELEITREGSEVTVNASHMNILYDAATRAMECQQVADRLLDEVAGASTYLLLRPSSARTDTLLHPVNKT